MYSEVKMQQTRYNSYVNRGENNKGKIRLIYLKIIKQQE